MAEPRKTVTAVRKAGATSVSVELDGEPWRKLPHEVVLACGLQPGLELDRARLRRLRAELRRVEALRIAGRLVRHRDLASQRLDRELARRRIAPIHRQDAVRALERAGIADDARIAAAGAEVLAQSGYGDEAICWRLGRRELPPQCIEEALATLEPEVVRARRVVEREGVSVRTVRLLARRGFGADAIEAVCSAVADEV